jgi:amylosucrase
MADLRALAADLRAGGDGAVRRRRSSTTPRASTLGARPAMAGDPERLAFYRTVPDRTEPDRYEATLPEVFPDTAPGNFTWEPALGRWVWTTFNAYQWDLDYTNPEVFVAMAKVMLDLAATGVDVLRLDAVPFLWKRVGTNCQNQPEVHELLQALRSVLRIAAPAVAFKAEAIVSPHDLVAYLGRAGTRARSATWPTTTRSWSCCGARWPPAACTCSRRPCAPCRRPARARAG